MFGSVILPTGRLPENRKERSESDYRLGTDNSAEDGLFRADELLRARKKISVTGEGLVVE